MSSRLKSDQRAKVKNFMACCNASEKTAINCLSRANWNIEVACDSYYQNPHLFSEHSHQNSADNHHIQHLFSRYANDPRDNLPNRIGPHGIVRLLEDLQLKDTDRRVLILACRLGSQTQCEFSWEEWRDGLIKLQVDNVDSLRTRLDQLDELTADVNNLRELYSFAFQYGKYAGNRNLELDVAVEYWNILLKDRFTLLPLWEEFMLTQYKRAVPRDTWNLLFDFAFSIRPDLSNYDEDGAWPVVLDNFVAWAKPRLSSSGDDAMMS